jgi:energy-coupling factor transporter transmembrane protein EcfT
MLDECVGLGWVCGLLVLLSNPLSLSLFILFAIHLHFTSHYPVSNFISSLDWLLVCLFFCIHTSSVDVFFGCSLPPRIIANCT